MMVARNNGLTLVKTFVQYILEIVENVTFDLNICFFNFEPFLTNIVIIITFLHWYKKTEIFANIEMGCGAAVFADVWLQYGDRHRLK